MRKLALFGFLTLVSCWVVAQRPQPSYEKLLCARLHYLLAAKKTLAADHWPAYGKRGIENEIRFYSANGLFLVQPQRASLQGISVRKCECAGVELYQIRDSVNTSYQMFTNFADGIAACNDLLLSRRYIPDVDGTETWAVMVLHEMFHQYQTNHPAFQQRALKLLTSGQYLTHDSIRTIYQTDAVFRKAVNEENDLLLAALKSGSKAAVDSMLTRLLAVRAARFRHHQERTGFDLRPKDEFEQIAEAGTRYIEYHFSNDLKRYPVDKALAAVDTSYHANRDFRAYSLAKEGAYLFTLSPSYYYALGFNSLRLLEKLGIPFRERMYAEPDYSFTSVFETYLQEKQKRQKR